MLVNFCGEKMMTNSVASRNLATRRSAALACLAAEFLIVVWCGWFASSAAQAADGARYHSDSNARYLHRIDLYDADNRRITADSTKPYSAMNTCGRCHDYQTISHGWHFNAFASDSVDGRKGEPWIWTDPRTGTQLPLSHRDWDHTYHPSDLGISSWEITKQFGSRIPGGGVAADETESASALAVEPELESDGEADADQSAAAETEAVPQGRWPLTGRLEIDCMVCHAVSGAYDFNERREQITNENFAWAATAALHLGEVDGNVSRVKDGSDPDDESVIAKLPKVTYDPARFGGDGKVFMDLIREPSVNACYQCHSNRTVGDQGIEKRWIHDEDVHLRAGMVCADCHRNGIDHHIVRGFPGEQNPSGQYTHTLSCAGCHLGDPAGDNAGATGSGEGATDSGAGQGDLDILSIAVDRRAGRLGSPRPLHAGLPPLHFEKLACTACHGGPVPRDQALGIMTSFAHGLGEKGHRTGQELPLISAPLYTKDETGRVAPHKAMWPAFWGVVTDGSVDPLAPNRAYEITRKSLRVRKDFRTELLQPKLKSGDLKEALGDERAGVDDEQWTDEEIALVDAKQFEVGMALFESKVFAALQAIEEELEVDQATYVSAGKIYVRGESEDELVSADVDDPKAVGMVRWPMAHNVRPAGWSLGVGGCIECHSDDAKLFSSTVQPTGPAPGDMTAVSMAALQGIDGDQRLAWNQLFSGRKSFKYVIGTSLSVLLLILIVGLGAFAGRAANRSNQKTP